jgi:CDP-paratose 2-epimerase
MQKILITGSSGLIGSEIAAFFHKQGFAVHGVDNNQRAVFFGTQLGMVNDVSGLMSMRPSTV